MQQPLLISGVVDLTTLSNIFIIKVAIRKEIIGGCMLDNVAEVSLVLLAFLAIFFVIMQIVSSRNMKKSRENMRVLQESLKPGVKVMLLGGIYGSLVKLNKDTAIVKIADNVEIKVDRSSIQSVIK